MTSAERTFDSAIAYADLGWPVLPLWSVDEDGRCLCGHKNCTSPGKHPHGKYAPNGYKNATTDGSIIAGWLNHNSGDINIGICTGSGSGLVVFDIDPPHGGSESLRKLENRYGEVYTLEVITGGEGRHLYFQHPGGKIKNSVGKLGPGLDLRADGAYVVAPPSLHKSGQEYRWKVDPRVKKPVTCPKWLVNGTVSHQVKTCSEGEGLTDGSILRGERNDTLISLGGSMRRRGMSERAILAALLEENNCRCDPPLERTEVEQIASSVSKYAPSDSENPDSIANKKKSKSQATQLVDLAAEAEVFHNAEGDAYATIAINGHYETWPVRSKWFRRWLIGQFWKTCKKAPGSQATQDALRVLASKAIYDGPEKLVSVRLAEHDGAIWLDLANSDWQAVKITQDRWEVVPEPPVKFLRPRGLSQLPQPVPGGGINLLRQFINLGACPSIRSQKT